MTNKYLLKEFTTFDVDEKESQLDPSKEMILKGILQRCNTLNQNGRVYPKDVLVRELNNYMKLIREFRAFGELDHCLDDKSEILTTSGWKLLKDISDVEEVYTLNTETNVVEREVILSKTNQRFDGFLHHLSGGRNVDINMTPNHNTLLWDRNNNPVKVSATDLAELWERDSSWLKHCSVHVTGDISKLASYTEDIYTIPGTQYSMPQHTWASLLGLWLAEGHVCGSKQLKTKHANQIGITQKKIENLQPIRELLSQTNLPWKERSFKDGKVQWTITDKSIWNYFKQFGCSSDKFIPSDIWNQNIAVLTNLHDWLLFGDGRNRKSPNGTVISELATTSRKLADDFAHLLFRLGKNGFVYPRLQKDSYIKGRLVQAKNCKVLWTSSENSSGIWFVPNGKLSLHREEYHGNVYCVSTRNGNFMTRRTGRAMWTGNSDTPIVNMKNVSHMISEIWLEGDVVWGKVKILDTPSGEIIKAVIKAGGRPGISSRALGSLSKQGEVNVVQDDLQIICWDFVSEPSTELAFMSLAEAKQFTGDTKKLLSKSDRIDRVLNDILSLKE